MYDVSGLKVLTCFIKGWCIFVEEIDWINYGVINHPTRI